MPKKKEVKIEAYFNSRTCEECNKKRAILHFTDKIPKDLCQECFDKEYVRTIQMRLQ